MEEKKYFYYLYQITNIMNGKIYIGVHCTGDLDDGYLGSGKHLKRAIKKHGKDNFKKTILQVCNSLKEVYKLEAEIVDNEFVNRENTYNICLGGNGGIQGRVVSETTRLKLSVANKGRKLTEEHRKKLSESHMGIKCSEVSKKKTSEIHKGKKHSLETRKKISEAHMGHKPSKESVRKMIASKKGKPNPHGSPTEEGRKHMSEAHMGHKHSDETRKKMSEALKASWLKRKSKNTQLQPTQIPTEALR
jgi:hypothetical protein